jgi:hypothetical protein
VLRFTDRAFTIATSTNPLVRFARTRIAPTLIPLILKPERARGYAFRTVSQLGIRYRSSPLSVNGPGAPRRGPKAGDRLPDARVHHDGRATTLHQITATPGWHLLLCGSAKAWPASTGIGDLVTSHHVSTADGHLGLCLVRPDGHIGYRSGGCDLTGLHAYLRRWLPAAMSTWR